MFWCDKGTSVDGMFLVWPALRRDVALVEGGGRCVCHGGPPRVAQDSSRRSAGSRWVVPGSTGAVYYSAARTSWSDSMRSPPRSTAWRWSLSAGN